MRINELYKYCEEQINKGNGNKLVYISDEAFYESLEATKNEPKDEILPATSIELNDIIIY